MRENAWGKWKKLGFLWCVEGDCQFINFHSIHVLFPLHIDKDDISMTVSENSRINLQCYPKSRSLLNIIASVQ